jgi:hypothetical protein
MVEYKNQHVSPHTLLILAGAAFVVSLILRQLPVLGWLVYPFQLFVTLIHELSHGLAAVLTGGRFLEFTIAPNTSGLATTAGGWRWLVIPAGYLGAALFGGLLLVLIHRSPGTLARRILAIGLGLFFALVTMLFARNLMAITVGGTASLVLLALGLLGSPLLLIFGLDLLAIQSIFNAVDSLLGLTRLNAGPFRLPNDAQAMADLTHVPAILWAILWSLAAAGILVGSLYLSLRRGGSAQSILDR